MKVLIIGFGSIGKRHYEVLLEISEVKTIDIVTKQNLKEYKTYKILEDVNNINEYDYFVISSETSKHFEQLKYLDKNVKDKLIFCEKPLFETNKELELNNNRVFVGYVLRFHPLLSKLKGYIKDENIILASAKCGQYLPTWRTNIDYRDSYSSKKEEGGGVLLDLSHEIDYVQWFCGEIDEIKSYQLKISDLEIETDDITMIIGKTTKNIAINISIDYISKLTHRKLLIETLDNTYELDFILNKLTKKNKSGLEEIFSFSNLERNYMYKEMHLDIFQNQKSICTFEEGINIMKTISTIQEQNR